MFLKLQAHGTARVHIIGKDRSSGFLWIKDEYAELGKEPDTAAC